MIEKKWKFAIVGTGNRGVYCFGKLLCEREDCEIIALVEPNSERSRAAAEILNIKPAFYPDVRSMLKEIQPDAVVISSPDVTHMPNAVAALEGGCNLLSEKPLATTVRDCKRIIEAAKTSGKLLMMGFNLRHHQTLKKLKEIISSGTLGRVFMIENRETYCGGRTYMARWNRRYEISGGLWIHKGSHDFDVYQWLLGFPKPLRVSAFAGINTLTPEHIPFEVKQGIPVGPNCRKCAYSADCPDRYPAEDLLKLFSPEAEKLDNYCKDLCIYTSDKNVHDNGMAMVEYDNGARAVHSECFIVSEAGSDRKYTVYGDRGTAEVSLAQRKIVIYPRWSNESVTIQQQDSAGGHGGADPQLVEAFLRALNDPGSACATAEHGMWSTAVGEAAELSWREHRTVEIAELDKQPGAQHQGNL